MNRREWFRRSALAGGPFGLYSIVGCGGQKPQEVASLVTAQPRETPATEKTPAKNGATDVLLFDIFGTVVDWRASLISQFQQFGRRRGLSADWQALAVQWQAGYLPSLDEV